MVGGLGRLRRHREGGGGPLLERREAAADRLARRRRPDRPGPPSEGQNRLQIPGLASLIFFFFPPGLVR